MPVSPNNPKKSPKTLEKTVKNPENRPIFTQNQAKIVYLGMSGGVDSSVSAVLLQEAGYTVRGVYMKNWSRDLPGMKCPWADDLADAKRVAVKLDIDFEVWDFESEYRDRVVSYMLDEFQKGRTPNPDIMCNQEIKFKLFYDIAKSKGADYIATGHYARTDGAHLLKAFDENKDQTYFLYRISEDAISHTLFPIGHMKKPDVKKLAEKHGLQNAYKKESMGICFVGEVGMKDFLKEYLPDSVKSGEIRDVKTDNILGYHEGAVFYTLGQRHGLYLGGGLPYYVVKKDLEKNIVYVSSDLNDMNLWTTELELEDVILRDIAEGENTFRKHTEVTTEYEAALARNDGPRERCFPKGISAKASSLDISVRLRHRAPLIPAKLTLTDKKTAALTFDKLVKRPASGQSAVIYSGDICLGGGIIE